MIRYEKGNLLEAQTEAYVNTVNTVGVMGKGIALQFKEAFPASYKAYKEACKRGEVQTGNMFVTKEVVLTGEKWIIHFPTKTDWKQKSSYAYIESGLQDLVEVMAQYQITSIALPPLGCGNGGLDWHKVRPMIEQHLGGLSAEVVVYEPNEAVKVLLAQQGAKKEVKLTPARAMFLYTMYAYESMGEPVSLFVVNKLAYFLQRIGEPLRLNFKPHHYGPYSEQVVHVLYNMNGKYLTGVEQRQVKPFEPLNLQYDTFEEVKNTISNQLSPQQRQRLDNLLSLIDGFQSAFSLEVLASVDYLLSQSPQASVDEIHQKILAWSDRKSRLIQKRHTETAFQHLQSYKANVF